MLLHTYHPRKSFANKMTNTMYSQCVPYWPLPMPRHGPPSRTPWRRSSRQGLLWSNLLYFYFNYIFLFIFYSWFVGFITFLKMFQKELFWNIKAIKSELLIFFTFIWYFRVWWQKKICLCARYNFLPVSIRVTSNKTCVNEGRFSYIL